MCVSLVFTTADTKCVRQHCLIEHFTISELKILLLYIVQKHWSTNVEALKFRDSRSGGRGSSSRKLQLGRYELLSGKDLQGRGKICVKAMFTFQEFRAAAVTTPAASQLASSSLKMASSRPASPGWSKFNLSIDQSRLELSTDHRVL